MAPQMMSEEVLYGMKPMTVYVSTEGHSSFDKAVDMLGIGKKYLRKIPVDDEFRIRTDLLEQQIQKDRDTGFDPACIIGIAGTTKKDVEWILEVVRDLGNPGAV
ncbi:MAG: pyridoxal-dependent decarboxylase [Balneolaceae bacterium]